MIDGVVGLGHELPQENLRPVPEAVLEQQYANRTHLVRLSTGAEAEGDDDARLLFDVVNRIRERYGPEAVTVNRISRDPDTQRIGSYLGYMGVWVDNTTKAAVDNN